MFFFSFFFLFSLFFLFHSLLLSLFLFFEKYFCLFFSFFIFFLFFLLSEAQNLIFFGLNFVTISFDISFKKSIFGAVSGVGIIFSFFFSHF